MKNMIIGLMLVTVLPVSAALDFNIKYGQTSSQVMELQDFLVDKGLLSQSTGFFGLLTLKAVKTYQVSQNLPSTGYVGILTRTKINEELSKEVEPGVIAEITETGTSTPIITPSPVPAPVYIYIPTPTPVYQPAQPIETFPKPTCTIKAEAVPNNSGDMVGKVSWTSTDADGGYISGESLNESFYEKGVLIQNTAASGYKKGYSLPLFTGKPKHFTANFTGKGGQTICEVDLYGVE